MEIVQETRAFSLIAKFLSIIINKVKFLFFPSFFSIFDAAD